MVLVGALPSALFSITGARLSINTIFSPMFAARRGLIQRYAHCVVTGCDRER